MEDRPYNVLLVEDVAVERKRYQEALEQAGFHVVTANGGREALKVQGPRPDLIISDINMPRMDGVELFGKIYGIYPYPNRVPFIFYSDYSNYKDNFLTWGADDYIVKRGGWDKLVSTARKIIDKREEEKRELALVQESSEE